MAQHIFVGTSAPSEAPKGIGHHYVDKTTKSAYLSVGTDSVEDWLLVTRVDQNTVPLWRHLPIEITQTIVEQNTFEIPELVERETFSLVFGNLSFAVDYDFTLTLLQNKTRVEFLNTLRAPNGLSAIALGDRVFIRYKVAQT
jgi:hypothetical protein